MSHFTLEIVTPDRKFFEEEVEMVVVRGSEGDIGILPNHTPLVTPLAIGRIKIKQNGSFKEASLSEGYVEIGKNKITVISDTAEWPEEIDVERAKAAKKRAEERLDKKTHGEVDILRAQVAFRKALTRINVAGKR